MSAYTHAVVWVDHREAKVFQFHDDLAHKLVIHSHLSVQRAHHRGHGEDDPHGVAVDGEFFKRIVTALDHTHAALLAGPGAAKLDLAGYINAQRPDLAVRISRSESPSYPGDAALVASAREPASANA